MSHTASAKLFWGFPIDREERGDGWDWEVEYAAAKGISEPEGPFDRDKYREYLDKKAPVVKASGCKIGHHGYEYSDDYVCVASSEITVDWGEARKLDSLYAVDPDWERSLKEFCRVLGIPYQTPGWHMVAHYS